MDRRAHAQRIEELEKAATVWTTYWGDLSHIKLMTNPAEVKSESPCPLRCTSRDPL